MSAKMFSSEIKPFCAHQEEKKNKRLIMESMGPINNIQ